MTFRLSAVLGTVILCAASASAGALFDDYLNYVRPGLGTGPGDAQVVVSANRPVGQTFTVSAEVGEIYRIGVRPIYDSWQPGEAVSMGLMTADGKPLGVYRIDESTSHIQPIYDREHRRNTDDRVLWYQFRAKTNGRQQFGFQLTVQGGDGKVAFKAFKQDVLPGGAAVQAGVGIADLAFEVHIKPVADREENLRKYFRERVNLDLPALSEVKAAVEKEDWEKAIAALVHHFHVERFDVWDAWEGVMEVDKNPDVDTTLADMIMKGFLLHRDTEKPVPWRYESYWMPEYPAKDGRIEHAVKPEPYWWHIGRELGGVYSATGDKKYARAAIDLRMQFILDNPNPKRSGLPQYFQLWNDRTAAARTPGHGDLVYARLYNFPGWTNDEKLVFMSFVEDNAGWVYKAESGGNWGAEASRACYEFGKKFPEWRMSKEYVNWGTQRLAEVTLHTARSDGVSTEAAVKYHAMVARRLKGMLKDCQEGTVTLEKGMFDQLMKTVEGMYDHMAYTTMPNGYVVMCGDSFYEHFEDLAEVGEMVDRPDFIWVGTQGKEGRPPAWISKVYPESGYYIMRSQPTEDEPYEDARHLFVHNGMWFASHGHNDLLSLTLYAYGRPLVIDPGQYNKKEGFDRHWQSKIHSMLVFEDNDTKREPGPNKWMSNAVMDWLDGEHYGYAGKEGVGAVHRKILFVRPNYFIVDDFADSERKAKWSQTWNLSDPQAEVDEKTRTIRTTFEDGGNLLIMNQDPDDIEVKKFKGTTATSEDFPLTRIVQLTRDTDNPRFQTLVYPYKGSEAPPIDWEMTTARRGRRSSKGQNELYYALNVNTPEGKDWIVFGKSGKNIRYSAVDGVTNADVVLVRMDDDGEIESFTWAFGERLQYDDRLLAESEEVVHNLAVRYEDDKVLIDAEEPRKSLAVYVGDADTIVLNGEKVADPVVKDGMYQPFAAMPEVIVADESEDFRRITQTNEWAVVADPQAWGGSYQHHETDPGRGESGRYEIRVPETGRYRVEVYQGDITKITSNKVEYTFEGDGEPAEVGGPILSADSKGNDQSVVVDQQQKIGWVSLGEFKIRRGRFDLVARNKTETDGIYFVADAARLVRID